jgi:hypothetical protein
MLLHQGGIGTGHGKHGAQVDLPMLNCPPSFINHEQARIGNDYLDEIKARPGA